MMWQPHPSLVSAVFLLPQNTSLSPLTKLWLLFNCPNKLVSLTSPFPILFPLLDHTTSTFPFHTTSLSPFYSPCNKVYGYILTKFLIYTFTVVFHNNIVAIPLCTQTQIGSPLIIFIWPVVSNNQMIEV